MLNWATETYPSHNCSIFRRFPCQFYLPTLARRLGIADQISGQAMPVRWSAVWGSCGQRAMGAGATTDRWPQLVIDPTLNRIIAGPKQPCLQNLPGLPEKGGVVSVSDGRREEGGDGCENERAEWQPRDRLIFSSFPIPLSSSPGSSRSLHPTSPADGFCWAPLYWIYELMEMSRHNRLGNKEEDRRWRRVLFTLPLSLMWRPFARSQSKLYRITENSGCFRSNAQRGWIGKGHVYASGQHKL